MSFRSLAIIPWRCNQTHETNKDAKKCIRSSVQYVIYSSDSSSGSSSSMKAFLPAKIHTRDRRSYELKNSGTEMLKIFFSS